MPVARLPDFSVMVGGTRMCRACDNPVYMHLPPPPVPAAGVAAAAAAPAIVVQQAAAPPPPPVVYGPGRVTRVEQFAPTGMTLLAHLALWKSRKVCVDDRDNVASAFETIESALFLGVNEVANHLHASTGTAQPTSATRFTWAPLPPHDPAVPDELAAHNALRRARSRDLMGATKQAEAVLTIARSYARRRMVLDKEPSYFLIAPSKSSDELSALSKARKTVPQMSSQELELNIKYIATPESLLWWWAFVSICPLDSLATALETCVLEFGTAYRLANPTLFVAEAVWATKHSAAVVAAKTKDIHTPPGKREREDSVDPSTHPGRNPPSKRAAKRKAYLERRAARRAEAAERDADREPASSVASAGASASPGSSPSLPTSSATSSPQSSAASGSTGGRGGPRSGGRNRGGRGRDTHWRRGG